MITSGNQAIKGIAPSPPKGKGTKSLQKTWLRILSLFLIYLLFVAIAGCRADDSESKSTETTDVRPADKAWIAKAYRVLRYRQKIDKEVMKSLENESEEEILAALMQGDDFFRTVLDFNMYFFGSQISSQYELMNGEDLHFDIYGLHPVALYSAYEALTGTEYLGLFSHEVPAMGVTNEATARELERSLEDGQTFAAYILERRGKIREIKKALTDGKKQEACDLLHGAEYLTDPNSEGFFEKIHLPSVVQKAGGDEYIGPECLEKEDAIIKMSLRGFEHILDNLETYYHKGLLHGKKPLIESMVSFKKWEDQSPVYQQFGTLFFSQNNNSSTNYNRKRAASVLKTYFCDDLTPVTVPLKESHAQDRHASDPACQSCHYKLDPLSAMFRFHGRKGFDFRNLEKIAPDFWPLFVFDDDLTLKRDQVFDYWNYWENHDIKPGVVQSSVDSKVNQWGDDLSDLARIIGESDQVKRCLVRRMAEYFIGTHQVFESRWLESLASEFKTTPNSTLAFKTIVEKLVRSQTFRQKNPDPNHCYDRISPSHQNGPPCQVATIIEDYCITCHSGAYASSGLDLGQWITFPNSGIEGFLQLDETGTRVEPCEVYAKISQRLSPEGPEFSDQDNLRAFQMPLNRDMDPLDRQEFVLWNNRMQQKFCK